ncbi:hypothetical protein [uncultured Marinobacter sp.]|jgi:hypothetical protein|uniref:hypothetical protein n=1 Tax=uncultured Marinobacter sp. TaxID=187379 RepID=UPI0025828BCD|nr:hypothetical protein [uncultured Marinobacter sp.]
MSDSGESQTIKDAKRLVKAQRDSTEDLSFRTDNLNTELDKRISETVRTIRQIGNSPPKTLPKAKLSPSGSLIIPARSWEELVEEAKQITPEDVSFDDLLSESEIQAVLQRHESIGKELGWFECLDRFDLTLAVSAGAIAGLMDVLLVKVPAHPGFLGSKGSEGGWLPNKVDELVKKLLPEDQIRVLEKAHKASYDPATNNGLLRRIAGLGPRTHRYQSLGHDPILGFFFGVRDILTGQFTAIDKFGKVIVQQVGEPLLEGEMFLVCILEALKTHVGHLLSDVATPAGLPAPLMPLLSFLQFGKIGNHEYTIAEVARQMYRSGYDFKFSAASGIPVLMTNVIIWLGNFIKDKNNERRKNAIKHEEDSDRKLTTRRQLLIAHSVGMLINAGKVSVTRNPLAVSWVQTLTLLRYVAPEMHFIFKGKEGVRAEMVEDEILSGFHGLNKDIDAFLDTQTDFVIQL